MSRPSRTIRKAITQAVVLLLFALTAGTAQAQVFVGADAGLSVLSQEGHAPPICCAERESWDALGGRVGGRAGYGFARWLFVRLDGGFATHRATTRDGHKLNLVTPDVALMLGAQRRGKLTADIALGAGWRWFSGSATSNRPGISNDSVSKSAPDLRLSFGMHRSLNGGHRLGGELSLVKVLIAEHIITFSLVYTWGPA